MDSVTININETVNSLSLRVTHTIKSYNVVISNGMPDLSGYALSGHSHGGLALTNITGSSASNGLTLSAGVGGGGGIGLNTAGTNITWTVNSSGISISNPAWLTTAMHSACTSVFQFTSNTSDITASALNASQSSLFQHTSATSAITAGAFPAANSTLLAGSSVASRVVQINNSSGNISFASASSLSSSVNGSTISWGLASNITTALQSAGAYLTTAANSTHSHGNPTLALTNLTGTTASASSGLTISLSAGAGGGIAASIGGNSTSAGAGYSNITSGTMVLAGGNNITLSQNGANITISGANVGGAQTGISGMGASNTTYTSGTVIISAQNNITVGSSVDGASQYVRLSVGNYLTTAMASNEPHIGGIVYSNATQTSGTVYFTGSNGISVASGANTVIISLLDNHHVDGVLPSGNGYGTGFSSITSGTFNINAVGALQMSQNGNALSLSVPTNYLTTAAQSNQVVNSFNGSTGQISFVTGSGMSTTTNASTLTFGLRSDISTAWSGQTTANQSRVVQINGSSGTLSFATGSSLSSSANGSTITWGLASNITTALQSTGAYLTTAANSTHTHGAPSITGSINITSNSNAWSISIPAFLTTAMLSNANTSFVGLNSAGTNITWTVNSSGISINNPAWLTTAALSSQTKLITLAGNSTSAGAGYAALSTGTIQFAGGNNITLSQNGNSVTISAGAGGGGVAVANSQTTYTSGTVLFRGTNATINTSAGGQYIDISVAAPGAGAALQGSGTYTQNSGTIQFANSNNVTFGLTNNSMTASVPSGTVYFSNANGITFGTSVSENSTTVSGSVNPAGGGVTEWRLYGNTSGTSSSAQTGAIYLAGGNNITLSGNSNTITISAGAGGAVLRQYENMNFMGVTQTMTLNSRTWAVFPFILPAAVTCSFLRLPVSAGVGASTTMGTTANTSLTASAANTIYAVIYTQGAQGGANSLSLQYLTSATVGMTNSFSFTAGNTGSHYTLSVWQTLPSVSGTTVQKSTAHAQTVTNIAISYNYSSALTGGKYIDFPFNTSLSGGNYFMAIGQSSTSNTNVAAATRLNSISQAMSHIVVSQPNLPIGGFGLATAVSSGSVLRPGGAGYWTTNVQGSTNSIAMAAISSSASHNRPYFVLYGY